MRWILGALLGLCVSLGAVAQERMRIQFAEPVSIDAAAGTAQFDAYGRRFNLTLQNNDRLLKVMPAGSRAKLALRTPLRGKLADAPGSWVRLAHVGNTLEGAIWDGHELYVVTSHERIAVHLTLALRAPPDQTVIYRLSDTLQGMPAEFCGVAPVLPRSANDSAQDPTTALSKYRRLVSELRANAARSPTDQLDIALVADTEFQQRYGADSTDVMLARLNNVDGIFAEQVGVLIVPTQFHLASGANPFTSTDAQTLLGQVAAFRESNAAIRAPGLAYLMTGKDLNGDTAGIAFVDALCDSHDGVSLGEGMWDFVSALIMAHELGHNFGARHDGVPGGACESVSPSFLMGPSISGSSQFSQCSLDAMAPAIARARGVCLVSPNYADVGVQFPPSPYNVDTSSTFSLPVTVGSGGNATATDVRLEIDLPSQLTFQSAVVSGGSCTAGASTGGITPVTCTLGDLAGAEQRVVELQLLGNVLGSFYAQARVSADNDFLVYNNTASVLIGLQSAVDLGVEMSSPPGPHYVGDLIDFTVDVSSLRTQAASGGTLGLSLGGIPIESVSAGAHACAIDPFNNSMLSCQLADIPGGTTTRLTVRGRPVYPNFTQASVNVAVAGDGDFGNNHRFIEVPVRAERQVVTVASTENLRAVIGVEYDVVFTLTTIGRLPSLDVQFVLDAPYNGVVLSMTPSAGTCSLPVPQTPGVCGFGDLNPGDERTVSVRIRMDTAGSSLLGGRTLYRDGTSQQYAYSHVWITSNLRVDAAPDFGSMFRVTEGQTGFGNFGFQSLGIDPAQNAVVTLDLPAPVRLTALTLSFAPPGWTCTIVTPQQARCAGSFSPSQAGGGYGRASFAFTSDTPLESTVTATLTADSDGDATNNVVTAPLSVLPNVDVSVSTTQFSRLFNLGTPDAAQVRVRTAIRAVPAARLWVSPSNLDLELDSIAVDGVDCAILEDSSQSSVQKFCELGDLPGGADIPVEIRYRALQADRQGHLQFRVSTQQDSNFGNDNVFVSYQTLAPTDIQISVAGTSITAVNGGRVRFPLITVTNGATIAHHVRVDVPIPSFASLDSVSSSGMCTGTTLLRCEWLGLAPGASATIDVQLQGTAVGSFTSNIVMSADNDSTAGNNAGAVAVSITAPVTGGGSSSGGGASGGGKKGGGGSLEWLTLVALGFMRARRWNRNGVMSRRQLPAT